MRGHEEAGEQVAQISVLSAQTAFTPNLYLARLIMWAAPVTSWRRREKPYLFMDGSSPWGNVNKSRLWLHYNSLSGRELKDSEQGKSSNRQICKWCSCDPFGRGRSSPMWDYIQILCIGQWPGQLFRVLEGKKTKFKWGSPAETNRWLNGCRQKVGRFSEHTLTATRVQPSWKRHRETREKNGL